jgi:hypothetical protein
VAKKPKGEKAERDVAARAFELRVGGASYPEISEAISTPQSKARSLVARHAAATIGDKDAEALALALARVDGMLPVLYARAAKGDRKAANTVLALERRRDVVRERMKKRLGLDAWQLHDLPDDVRSG